METKRISFSGSVLSQIFAALPLVMLAMGCASARKAPTPVFPPMASAENPAEPFGPPMPGQAQPSAPAVPSALELSGPPDPLPTDSVTGAPPIRPVVLVLGPGRARGYSYAGVFRALHEKKIPIGAVLGTEMGGLMAALYGLTGNLNQFEWGLLKLKDEIFLRKEGFFSRFSNDKPADSEKLESELRQVFEKKDLRDFKLPVRIVLQSKETGMTFVLGEGDSVAAVRGAIATPGMFSPGIWQSEGHEIQVVAASGTRPFLVSEAKKLNLGPVIVVSVLSDIEAKASAEELSQADLVIRPDLKGLGYHDFKKRNEIAFRGKTAILEHLSEIRRLIGIPGSTPSQENPPQENPTEKSRDAK